MPPWITSVRILLDTDILISGLITPAGDRPPALLLDAARQERVTLVSSAEQLQEFKEVAARPHLQKYLKAGVVEEFLRFIDAVAEIVETPLPVVTESPDPKDNMILASAIAGRADLIVSGDKRHILALGTFRNIPIVTPAQAVALLQEHHED